MKRAYFFIATLLLFPAVIFAATKQTSSVLNIQHWQTKNGAEVYFVQSKELPMLDINVIFKAGSAYDKDKLGVASFVNSMLDEGTKKAGANQIATQFDSVGAQYNAGVDRDKAYVGLRSLTDPKYLNPALNTFADIIQSPTFPQKSLQRIRQQTEAAIKVGEQTAGSVANTLFYQLLYKKAPYAHDPLGTIKSVKQINQNDLLNFYKRFYVAKNADIVLVGDVTRSQAKSLAERIVKSLPSGQPAPELQSAAPLQQAMSQHIRFPSKQTTILIGQVGISRRNPNYFPLIVGNYILGGLPSTSLIIDQVREKRGLAYAAYSYFYPLQYHGPFLISLKTRANQSQNALALVRQVLDQFVKNGPTQEQLAAAKEYIIGSFVLGLATNNSIASTVSNIAFYKRPLDFLDQYRANVNAVSVTDIKNAVQNELHPNKMLTVTVGAR